MSKPEHPARYIVGIDLGTSNSAVGFVDTHAPASAEGLAIQSFAIAQLIAPGEVAARALLPSCRYHLADNELSAADQSLAWPESLPELRRAVVGVLAQQLGSRVPGRFVASAKSWLCHAGVQRRAAILPWGAPDGVAKVSPVDASASYLSHMRAAWDAAHPAAPLAAQEVVLTVPASFDEVARALTLEAAKLAGLPALRLLEEPQAALYDFIHRRRNDLETVLAEVQLVLVVDVGGGTTDLTLVRVEQRETGLRFTRIAVGDHLMLGGDNMDHALARVCESSLSTEQNRLPAARFAQLIQQCRSAKEQLLAAGAAEQQSITLLGAGSSVVAGNVTTVLTRALAEQTVVDGFFPAVDADAQPLQRRSGLVEFGLPFAADPVITRHVAAFLARHRTLIADTLGVTPEQAAEQPARTLPDAVLLNGGVFRSQKLHDRMLDVLASFRGTRLCTLDNPDPDLAVARGAVAYGLARRGLGLKIGGGSARSYYMHVQADEQTERAVCILPRGAEEGEPYALRGRRFGLRIGEPVRFRVLTSTSEQAHRPGDLIATDERYQALPDLAAVIDTRSAAQRSEELQVELEAQLTEVGTLEMNLVAVEERARRYRLEFQLRGDQPEAEARAQARVTQLHARFGDATTLVQSYYGKAQKELAGKKILTLRSDLEKLLGPREQWDTALLRELFGQVLAGGKRRRRSADHERLWFHLAGYCLRPGFGYPVDNWRIEQLWALYRESVQFGNDAQVWSQFWICWRRIAGGLDEAQQTQLFDDLVPYLEPPSARRAKSKGLRAQGLEDMARLAASLERISAAHKSQLGEWLLARLEKSELSQPSVYWSLGRLGARAPWYGSAHTVVPGELATRWLERLLALDLRKVEQVAFAVAQLARLTNDRARDLDPQLRARAAHALTSVPGSDAWITLIREGGEFSLSDASRVFGESLPQGLRLLDQGDPAG